MLLYIPQKLKNNIEFIKNVVQLNFTDDLLDTLHTVFKWIPEKYQEDRQVISQFINRSKRCFQFLLPTTKKAYVDDVLVNAGDLQGYGLIDSEVIVILKVKHNQLKVNNKRLNEKIILDLRYNNLTEKSFDVMLEFVKKNSSMLEIQYDDGIFSMEKNKELEDALQLNNKCYEAWQKGLQHVQSSQFTEAVFYFMEGLNHHLFKTGTLDHQMLQTLIETAAKQRSTAPGLLSKLLPLDKVSWGLLNNTPSEIKYVLPLNKKQWVSGHADGTIIIWDIENNKPAHIFFKVHYPITHLMPVPESTTEFISFDGYILNRWKLGEKPSYTSEKIYDTTVISISPEGTLITNKHMSNFTDTKNMTALLGLSDSQTIVGYTNGLLQSFDISKVNKKNLNKPSDVGIKMLERLGNKHWISVFDDGLVQVWDNNHQLTDEFYADSPLIGFGHNTDSEVCLVCKEWTVHRWTPSLKPRVKPDFKGLLKQCPVQDLSIFENKKFSDTKGGNLTKIFLYDDLDLACKKVQKDDLLNNSPSLRAEMEVMLSMKDNPLFMQLKGFIEDENDVFFVMDKMDGTLKEFLEKYSEKLTRSQRFDIILRVVLSVFFLHMKGISHRDIKTENFLVKWIEDKKELKIMMSDFGTSGDSERLQYTMSQSQGTPYEIDPWIYKENKLKGKELKEKAKTKTYRPEIVKFSPKCDTYSVGVLLREILKEKYEKPWKERMRTVSDVKIKCQERLPKIGNIPIEWENLIQQCCVENRNERPDIITILATLFKCKEEYLKTK